MMKKIILFTGLAILLAACAEKPGYKISGTVADATLNGQYVYLYPYGERDAAPLDSALVSNETFAFAGVQETPALRVLRFSSEVVEPARTTSGLNAPFSAIFTLENAKLAAVLDKNSSVTGTPENDAFAAFQKELIVLKDQIEAVFTNANEEDPKSMKAAEAEYMKLAEKQSGIAKAYLLSNKDKLIAGKTLYDFRYELNEEDQNAILLQADSVFKSAPGVDRLIAHLDILKTVAVGQKFTDFEMADMKGEVKKLSDYVGQGKYVLVDFWASWCGPCRREIPNMVEAYKKYKAKGFEIVGISLDNDKDAWVKGTKDLGITWPQMSDLKGWQNAGAAIYGVNSIPHVLLIDKEGTIIAKNLHGEELNKKLEELFK